MSNYAIRVENVSKRYRIGMKEQSHDSLGGALASWAKKPLSNYKRLRKLTKFGDVDNAEDIIWALRNVSFEVKEGEVLGIIGKNGAGKSTMLKVLSRITDPTGGRISIKGRVSSLLEVGTGFHPELTGRDNVYLNGTILGMRKKEIDRKFDEIVEFSGTRQFIDTPIKRYSSGMKVRLAFAVAAHIEPEVLIIDEVLAVGDQNFQRKSLGKMEGVAKEGRTVLFVSHNMMMVNRLCHNVIWLEDGMVKMSGPTNEVIGKYITDGTSAGAEWVNNRAPSDDQEVFIESVRLLTEGGMLASVFKFGQRFSVEMVYRVYRTIQNLSVNYQVYNSSGIRVFESQETDDPKHMNKVRDKGAYRSICHIHENLLMPDRYTLFVSAHEEKNKVFQRYENVMTFEITNGEEEGYRLKAWKGGIISPVYDWKIERLQGVKQS